MYDIDELKQIIASAENIVFFGGAGVSTASGIPDFRGSGGLYTGKNGYDGADVLIVGGTSLTVHPAASLVELFEGEHLIIINQSPTPYDEYAEYVVREPIEDVLRELVDGE